MDHRVATNRNSFWGYNVTTVLRKKKKEEQDLDIIRLSFIGVSLEGVEEFVLRFFSKKENEKDDDSRRYVSLKNK